MVGINQSELLRGLRLVGGWLVFYRVLAQAFLRVRKGFCQDPGFCSRPSQQHETLHCFKASVLVAHGSMPTQHHFFSAARLRALKLYWVLVKEFTLCFHNRDLEKIIWILYYGNLNYTPQQEPSLGVGLGSRAWAHGLRARCLTSM